MDDYRDPRFPRPPTFTPPPATPQVPSQPGLTSPYAAGSSPYDNRLGMDSELLAGLLGTYGDQLELSDLEKQEAQARALRETAMPEGRSSGRVYTAANPLEFLGTGLKQYAGYRDEKKARIAAEGKRKTIKENVATVGKKYLENKDDKKKFTGSTGPEY